MKSLATLALLGVAFGAESEFFRTSLLPRRNEALNKETSENKGPFTRSRLRHSPESDNQYFSLNSVTENLADHELGSSMQKMKKTVCEADDHGDELNDRQLALLIEMLKQMENLADHELGSSLDKMKWAACQADDEIDNELEKLSNDELVLFRDALHEGIRMHQESIAVRSVKFEDKSDNDLFNLSKLVQVVTGKMKEQSFFEETADNNLLAFDDVADNNLLALGDLIAESKAHHDVRAEVIPYIRPSKASIRLGKAAPLQARQYYYVENQQDEALFALCIPTIKKGKMCFNQADG